MTIAEIRAILPTMQAEIPSINFSELIIDDSQLTEFLQKRNKDDNNMLFFIIPEHSTKGSDDSIISITNCQILIMNKYSGKINHEQFLDVMQSTEDASFAVRNWMLAHKANYPCGLFAKLVDSSCLITTVYNFVSCNGHSLIFNVES